MSDEVIILIFECLLSSNIFQTRRVDSAYIGPLNNRLTCSELLNDFEFLTAVEYNRHLNTIRAHIEQCTGWSKRVFSIGTGRRYECLNTSLDKFTLFDKLAVYLAAIMRMRDHLWQSNSAVLSMKYQWKIAKTNINEKTKANLFTIPGRKMHLRLRFTYFPLQ